MPGLTTPVLTITIDRQRMLAECTLTSNIVRHIDGSDRPFSPQHRVEAQLESHDAVRLKLLYKFKDVILRTDLNVESAIGVHFKDTIATSLLNEDKIGGDEIEAYMTLFDANNVVLDRRRSNFVKIHAMRTHD